MANVNPKNYISGLKLRMTQNMFERVRAAATKERQSLSEYVRSLLEEHLPKLKRKKP